MDIRVIPAQDRQQWNSALAGMGPVDPYFTSEYATLFDEIDAGHCLLWTCGEGPFHFGYPFRVRPLSLVPGLESLEECYDITANYGYGGPLWAGPPGNARIGFAAKARAAFDEWCQASAIVAEFCRFHPMLGNAEVFPPGSMDVSFCNQTVWIDLGQPEDLLIRGMSKGHRTDLKRAIEAHGRILVRKEPADVERFYEIYRQTMQAVQANSYYFFNQSFFDNTLGRLGDRAELISALYEDECVASSIFLFGDEFAHYHFSGMRRNTAWPSANKLLLLTAARMAQQKGLRAMHLGGGFGGSDDDSLMRFKSGFSKQRAEFHVGKRIHHAEAYAAACAAAGVDGTQEKYFPAYRAKRREGARLETQSGLKNDIRQP